MKEEQLKHIKALDDLEEEELLSQNEMNKRENLRKRFQQLVVQEDIY